ncbi:RNA exonuclease 1-like protein [Aphelenchoides besseyi]|nr:RNA exonuclease 1-like protein [Aphelenchoides besseyi]
MIPIDSVFRHLCCPYVSSCQRSYCRYSHPVQPKKPAVKKIVEDDQPLHPYLQEDADYSHEYQASYTNRVVKTTTVEYQQVHESYDPQFVKPKPQILKKKSPEYSALEDKPKVPVELGNDEILLGLPGATKPKPRIRPGASRPSNSTHKPTTSNYQIEQPNPRKRTIDEEKELREIEILEKKTRLLKEYKQLAEEIAMLEGKQANGKSIDEILGEKPAPKYTMTSSVTGIELPKRKTVEPIYFPKPKAPIIAPARNSALSAKGTYRDAMINRMASSSRPLSSAQSKSTAAASVPKDLQVRQAHAAQNLQILPVDMHNAKISFPYRTKCLRKIYDEFLCHNLSSSLALQMSQQEEKTLLDRCQTQSGYTSALAGLVRGIRNKQFTLPTNETEKVISVSETMKRKRENRVDEKVFYSHLREKYNMTAEQLRLNGYPLVVKDTDGKKKVQIDGDYAKKLFVEDSDLRRLCCRCGDEFTLKSSGEFVSQADCIHHWKRPFKKRINKQLESRYACCDSDMIVKGCVVGPCHVHDQMRRSVLSKFTRTPPETGQSDQRSGKVYAMDCEMVYTTWGMSVARVSLVDINDELVLDILIRPTEKILDCNTKFSGLTEAMLMNAKCNLNEAWTKFFQYVNAETILVGHSLESDLRAMRLVHRNVVDTSIVFPHRLGPPAKRALRNLASDYLTKIIQEDVEGHDSKEDASACMQLMLYKVRTDLGIPTTA